MSSFHCSTAASRSSTSPAADAPTTRILMNRATTLTLAATLAVAVIATAGDLAAAKSGGSTEGSFAPPSGDVPPDWTSIVDDTGTLGISVPSAWTATDGSPVVD